MAPTQTKRSTANHKQAGTLGTLLAVLLAPVLLSFLLLDAILVRALASLNFNDFGKFYYATAAFVSGGDMYGSSPATHIPAPQIAYAPWPEFLDLNPPHFHVVMLPVVGLPIEAAFAIWAVISVASLVLTAWMVFRVAPLGHLPGTAAMAVVALLAGAPTWSMLITGQLSWFMLAPAALVWLDVREGRATPRSGLIAGVLTSIKPFFAVLIVHFLLKRQYRAVAWSVAGCISAVAFGAAVFGLDTYAQWVATLSKVQWTWAAMNASLPGAAARVLDINPYYTPLAVSTTLERMLAALGPMAIVGVSLWFANRDEDGDRVWLILTLAAILASPLGWVYYAWFPLLAVPGLISKRFFVSHRFTWLFAGVVLLIPLPVVLAGQPSPWLTLTLGSAYFWGLAAAWFAAVRTVRLRPNLRESAAVPSLS